jgi:hypothetical protein
MTPYGVTKDVGLVCQAHFDKVKIVPSSDFIDA